MSSSIKDKNQINLVFLHGWGGCWQSWFPIIKALEKNYSVFAPDLPGHGQEKINKPLSLSDYSDFIKKYLQINNIKNPILIGHSFGGAIVCKIAIDQKIPLSKIILVDAAAIRHTYSNFQKTKFKILGLLKKLFPFTQNFYYKLFHFQDSDYAALKNNPIMQQTFKNIIQDDLTKELPKIKNSTLIIWGENDTATPLTDGLKIQKLIPKSTIKIIKNAGHFSYLDDQQQFITEIKNFIEL